MLLRELLSKLKMLQFSTLERIFFSMESCVQKVTINI